MMASSCVFMGHRPASFSFGYNESDDKRLQIKETVSKKINLIVELGVTNFYTGMALATD